MNKTTVDPNHSAHIVALANVRPHPNADRLKLATVLGTTIVVGLDAEDGNIGLYFQSGLQLNVDYAKANDLIRRKDPKTGKPAGGMFDENCRVRTQSLRGEKSDGFFIGLDSLVNYGLTQDYIYRIRVGDYYQTVDGKPICSKYIVKNPNGKLPGKPQKAAKKASYPMFKEHFDTTQSRFVMDKFERREHITITEKLHGTSQRSSCTLVKVEHKGLKKFLDVLLGRPINHFEWKDIHGTRRVILDNLEFDSRGFHDPTMRQKTAALFEGNMRKGETFYYEVVGYENESRPIMGRCDNSKVSKDFKKEYGKETIFSYGTEPGECEVYVYRITITTVEGYSVDLPWKEVQDRCAEIGVKTVPTLADGPVEAFDRAGSLLLGDGEHSLTKTLGEIFDLYAKGPSTLDQRHIKEGICIRKDITAQPDVYKHKSFEFKVLEGIIKPETASDNVEEEL
jgi:hypothetical protein